MKGEQTKEFYERHYALVKRELKRKIYKWRNELLKATLIKDCMMNEANTEDIKLYLHQCKKQLKKSIKEYKEYVKTITERKTADGEHEARELRVIALED